MTDLKRRDFLLLAALTVAALLVQGYHAGLEDDSIYLPAIKHQLDPALYPHDAEFFTRQLQASFFDEVVALSAWVTRSGAESTVFVWHILSIFLVLLGCLRLARRCFGESGAAAWGGVALVATLLTLPVTGTALYLVDQHLHPRTLATAGILFALSDALEGRRARMVVWLALAAAMHPLMAAFGASLCVFLVWKPGVRLPAAALVFPFSSFLQPGSEAWREATATRGYYFLSRWAWYEWLGVFAPLAILGGIGWIARRRGWPGLEHLARRVISFAGFQFIVAVLLTRFERLLPWQPMRYLHLVYLLMVLLLGGLLGRFVFARRRVAWLALVPLAAGMFWAQRELCPASPHLELPFRRPGNAWVEAFRWIRGNTPPDALFALDPEYLERRGEDHHGFRALAERSMMADTVKDPAAVSLTPALAERWRREVRARRDWLNFGAADFIRLKHDFGVSWVVVEGAPVAGLTRLYRNAAVSVCRID